MRTLGEFYKTFALGALSLLSAPSTIQAQESAKSTPPTATVNNDSAAKQLTDREYESAARAIIERASELGLTPRVSHPPNCREGEWRNPIFIFGQIHSVDGYKFTPEAEKYSKQLVELIKIATHHKIDRLYIEGAPFYSNQNNQDFWRRVQIPSVAEPTRLLHDQYGNSNSPRFFGAEDPLAVDAIIKALSDYRRLGREGAFSLYGLLLKLPANPPVSVAVNSKGEVTRVILGDGPDKLALSADKYRTLKSFMKTLGDILSSDQASIDNKQSSEARERYLMSLPSGSAVVIGATHPSNILRDNHAERSIVAVLPPEEIANPAEEMRDFLKAEAAFKQVEVEVLSATVVAAREQLARLKPYLGGSLGPEDFDGEGPFANYVQLINDSVLAKIKPELEAIVKSEGTSLSYLTFFTQDLRKCYVNLGEQPSIEVIRALEKRAEEPNEVDKKKLARMIQRLRGEK
jgi:hypothetical protein